MNADKAAENLAAIRQLMERPIRYSTMSGLSGIFAGGAALAGLAVDSQVCANYRPREAMWMNMIVWAGVFVAALMCSAVLTHVRERRQGMPFWSPIKRRILMTILAPFICGVGLTAAIMYRWYIGEGPNQWGLIPALWMTFYGVALWQVGSFSIGELRAMAVAFILAGLLTAWRYQYAIPGAEPGTAPYWTLGVTFGGFHIVYGVAVWIRHGG